MNLQNPKIWIGPCRNCSKPTAKTCKICNTAFYCSNSHEKLDYNYHKKACFKTLKEHSDWKKKKVLDLKDDILKIASTVFMMQYASWDHKIGTRYILPLDLKEVEGVKVYKTMLLNQDRMMEEYRKRGFEQFFDEIYALGKASLFHTSLVLAMHELVMLDGVEIVLNGESLQFYATATVEVQRKYQPIHLVHQIKNIDQSDELKTVIEFSNQKEHKVVVVSTPTFERILIDFTAIQYGIEPNITGLAMPVWMERAQSQKDYHVKELIFQADIQNYIKNRLENGLENEDFFAIAVLTYKNRIVQEVKKAKSLQRDSQSRGESAVRITTAEALEKGLIKEDGTLC